MIRSQLSRVILWNGALSAMPGVDDQQVDRAVGRARFVERRARSASGSVTSHWIGRAADAFGDGLQRLQPAPEQ